MFKWVWYNGEYVLFCGQALLDPGTLILGNAASQHMAEMICRCLNERLGNYNQIEVYQYAELCAAN